MISVFHSSLLLVGAGNWGKHLARNFHQLGALHTICDANEEHLSKYADLYPGIRLATNYADALKNPAIDKVAIAAPACLHYTLAKIAIQAGKDVYVEKPLCLTSDEAAHLIELAERSGLILMVGHLLQYHPAVQRLQELVKEGVLGKLQYIASNRLNLGLIRTEEDVLFSFIPHDLSVILSLTGHALPTQISSTGGAFLSKNIADIAMTTMSFSNNLKAHIYASWLNPFKEQKLTVVGEDGSAVFDDLKPWNEKLTLYRNPVSWSNRNIPKANKCVPETIDLQESEPLKNECTHFLTCCQLRKTPKTDGHEGLRVLKVLEAATLCLSQSIEDKATSSPLPIPYFAHPTAFVDQGAFIGKETKIWHFSHLMDQARVGMRCNIGQNVVISPGVVLGNNVKVQNNVSIYTGVTCEDDVFLGPSMVFTNVINPRSAINRRGEYQTTYVKRGATIGANATIVCGIEIGEYAFIGAGSVVTKNVKPYALVVGNPSVQIGWMSKSGERLNLPVSLPQDSEQSACCPISGEEYQLNGDLLSQVTTPLTCENDKLNYAMTTE